MYEVTEGGEEVKEEESDWNMDSNCNAHRLQQQQKSQVKCQ